MENKEKNNIYYRLLMISAIIIPVIIGFSYAYFLAVVKVTDDKTTTIQGTVVSDIDFELVDENNVYITASNLIPLTPDQISIYAETGNFTVRAGNNPYIINYTISLTDVSIPDELKTTDFKWRLICTSCSDNSKNAEGNFSAATTDLTLKTDLLIEANSVEDYKIMIWLEESGEDQTNTMNKIFKAKVRVDGELTTTPSTTVVPSEYQIVEYIESTGTQYIDTEFIPNQDTIVEAKLYTEETGSKNWFGSFASTYKKNCFSLKSYNSTALDYSYGDVYYRNIYNLDGIVGESFIIKYGAGSIILNGNVITSLSTNSFQSTHSILIFYRNGVHDLSESISGRVYYFKIFDNNNLVRNFIPTKRKSDNIVGLYDVIGQNFYTNAEEGSDNFIAGPNV